MHVFCHSLSIYPSIRPPVFFQISIFNTNKDYSIFGRRDNWQKTDPSPQFFLSHNKTLSIKKSRWSMLREVRLHLAPSTVLIISGCPVAQHHTGSYLLMTANLLHRPGNFSSCFPFGPLGSTHQHTYTYKHASQVLLFRLYTHSWAHTLSLVSCPRQIVLLPHKC